MCHGRGYSSCIYFEMFDFIQLFDPMGGDCASRVVCLRAVVCRGDIVCHYCMKIFNRLWPVQVLLDSSWSAVGDNEGEGGYARTGTGWNQRLFGPLQGTVAQVAGIGPRGWITKGWKGTVQYEEQ